jgi:signal transduction histidine kinase
VGERLQSIYGYIRSWMSVPLVARGRVIGKLSLDHGRPGTYSSHHADLALAFANQVAVAIDNAELYERAGQRAAQIAAVQRVSAAIAGTLDLESLLQLVAQAIQTAAGYEVAVVSLAEGDPPRLRRVASVGLDPSFFVEIASKTTPLAQFTALAREEYRLGSAYFFPGGTSEERSRALPSFQVMPSQPELRPGQWHPENMLIEPLVDSSERLVGLISVDKPYDGQAPTAESVEILHILAHQATIAIVNARLYVRAKESAVAAERSRLARDLHDAVTQTLFSASLIAEVLPRLYEKSPEEGRRRSEELRQLTRGALAEMRSLLLELRPSALTDAALGSLLRQLAEATTGRARIPVLVEVDGDLRLPPEVQVALYRVAQEALNNVAKHSEASRAVVSLRASGDRVELEIADDGRGFDVERARPDSLGVGIMRERIDAIGATLRIESEPGRGTRVGVCWTPR